MPKPKRRSLALERLEHMLEQPPHARRAALPNERAARVNGRWHSITARLLSLQYEAADGSDWTHLWRSANVLARVGADNPRIIAQLDRAEFGWATNQISGCQESFAEPGDLEAAAA